MKLAIFDLDNTLIAGDSDFLWGCWLAEQGHVDATAYFNKQKQYYKHYHMGTLDIKSFLRFQLQILKDTPLQVLQQWRKQYMQVCIEPIILPLAQQLIDEHRQQGHELLIATATNRFITEPIAMALNIPNLIATEAEMVQGEYTGNVSGIPSYGDGKKHRLINWLAENRVTNLEKSWFYSDSHTDIPLLEWVDHAVAINPNPQLRKYAEQQGWKICSLR